MKLRLLIFCLLISFIAAAQPTNYTKINARYRWTGGMFDSSFHLPGYNGTPTGTRTGSWNGSGALAADTANGRLYLQQAGSWLRMAKYSEITTGWSLTGDAGTTAGTNFIGTTDAVAFVVKTDNTERARVTSAGNVGVGTSSPVYPLDVAGKIGINGAQVIYRPDQTNFTGSLFYGNGGTNLSHTSGSTGMYNTGSGINALDSVTTGYFNTAHGANSLKNLTTGHSNTADGVNALFSLKSGSENVANGLNALYSLTTGDYNTAQGFSAGLNLTTGQTNVILGNLAMYQSTTSLQCVSIGYRNLQSQTTGFYNTSVAYRGMESVTTGYANSGLGLHNLSRITTGYLNTGIGYYAGDGLTGGADNNFFGGAYSGSSVLQKTDARHSFAIGAYSYTTRSWEGVIGAKDSTKYLKFYATDSAQWVGLQRTTTYGHLLAYDSASGNTRYIPVSSISGGGGSVSSASGTGVSLVNGSSAIKRLKAGTGITITDNTDSVTIAANDFDWDISEQFIPTLVTPFSYYNTGSGSGSALTLDPSNSGLYNAGYGWLKLVTGTTSSGFAGFRTSNSDATRFRSTNTGTVTLQFDNVGLSALSDGTDTYTMYIGAMPYSSSSEPNNGIYFKYTHSVNSGNWTCVTANGGSRTSTNSTVAVAANTPFDLRIAITSGTATFYVNGVQVASQSTNFPDNVAMQPWHGMIVKSVGTSDREMWVDAVRLKYE